jgi:hypothetical protein
MTKAEGIVTTDVHTQVKFTLKGKGHMKKTITRTICAAGLAGAVLVAGPSRAEAAPVLTLTVCQDGIVCALFASGSTATIGDYSVSASASSFESGAGSESADTAVNVQRVGNTNAAPLSVFLQATGYMLPIGPGFSLASSFGASGAFNPGTASISNQAWMSNTNAGFVAGTPPTVPGGAITDGLIACTPAGGGGTHSCSANSASAFVPVGSAPPFSLLSRVVFNIALNDSGLYGMTAQNDVTAVPEPASLLLLGSGLAGVAGRLRRKAKAKA